ncbi:SUN domain-containing protein 1-like, partial [Anarrhichthys ocellatus]|uniref:SUN domain-containing protein 1-like n=1 Tax=Anarrhichthys ocellatus TaxID=433405 RepID=UPI0012ED12E9
LILFDWYKSSGVCFQDRFLFYFFQEVQWRREAATTVSPSSTLVAAVSEGVDRQSHEALLAEVARLEDALEEVRRDVEGLSVCQDGCRRLDTIQQTISAQVREEVRVLVYGNQLTVGGDGAPGLPEESLLWWLSQHHVSGADLQEALLSLELSILQNVSLQLEQHRGEETVREAVMDTAVTQEDVQEMVKNALRLFSQDRTGLADFALESGGGSILSTRCSETYETKAALLSLFGLPLWYFSQSPRVVIQPDVKPGNCWAFRGSTGVLVIRLSMRILPTAFTMEHIPRTLAPSGTLTSAPRDFTVYGLEDEADVRGKLLGSFTFDQDGESLQSYRLTEDNDAAFQIIEVQVLSNWGHEQYTCMYRFRVHGTPEDPRDIQSAYLRDGRVLAANGARVSSH